MKLYGSKTSPYVRRLRLLMENVDYEFISLNVFEGEDRKLLQQLSPIAKVPILVNEPDTIYDSKHIFDYLAESSIHPKLTLDERNTLLVIDGVIDSFVNFYQLEKSNINIPKDSLYYRLNNERIENSLTYLNNLNFESWDYVTMSLYAMLDWIKFRNLYDLSKYNNLNSLINLYKDEEIVKITTPL